MDPAGKYRSVSWRWRLDIVQTWQRWAEGLGIIQPSQHNLAEPIPYSTVIVGAKSITQPKPKEESEKPPTNSPHLQILSQRKLQTHLQTFKHQSSRYFIMQSKTPTQDPHQPTLQDTHQLPLHPHRSRTSLRRNLWSRYALINIW